MVKCSPYCVLGGLRPPHSFVRRARAQEAYWEPTAGFGERERSYSGIMFTFEEVWAGRMYVPAQTVTARDLRVPVL